MCACLKFFYHPKFHLRNPIYRNIYNPNSSISSGGFLDATENPMEFFFFCPLGTWTRRQGKAQWCNQSLHDSPRRGWIREKSDGRE